MHLSIYYLLLLTFLHLQCNRDNVRGPAHEFWQVTRVVDGDTFWVDDGSEQGVKVGLIGIDAPEPRNAFRKKEQPYGKQASAYMTRLIEGKNVRLTYDVGKFDRYGRTLAYAYLEDGTFVNARIVADGFATVMTIPPNVKFAEKFLKLQRQAQRAGRGLWARE